MKNKCNTLFFKIIIVVLGAILCLAGALSVLNIKTSQDVFVENFVESQQKIFRQIDENIYELFQNVTAATSVICGSSSVREYLGREKWEAAEEFRNILDVKKILQQQLGCHHPAGGFAAAGHTDQYDIAAVCLHFLVLNSSLFGSHTYAAASTVCQGAPLALRAAGRANIPPKQHNAVAKIRPHIRGNDLL